MVIAARSARGAMNAGLRPLASLTSRCGRTQGDDDMQRILFIGHIGSDAGGWYIGADGKIHRVPGWNPEQLKDLTHAVTALRAVSQIKATGVA